MNKIEKLGNTYTLTTENGQTFTCGRWFEQKSGHWHVIVPKEARELCGRTYIREKHFEDKTEYYFETKTEHRTGMSNGGWQARMTEEEKVRYEEALEVIEQIKTECMNRRPKELTEAEKLELQIAKLMAKLEKAKA